MQVTIITAFSCLLATYAFSIQQMYTLIQFYSLNPWPAKLLSDEMRVYTSSFSTNPLILRGEPRRIRIATLLEQKQKTKSCSVHVCFSQCQSFLFFLVKEPILHDQGSVGGKCMYTLFKDLTLESRPHYGANLSKNTAMYEPQISRGLEKYQVNNFYWPKY